MQSHAGFTSFCSSLALLSHCSLAARLIHGLGGGGGVDIRAKLHRLWHGLPPRGTHGQAICLTAKEWAKSISTLPSWTDDRLSQWQGPSPLGPSPSGPPFYPPLVVEADKKEGGMMVRDETNDDLKPHRCFEGHVLWYGATFFFLF